MKRVVIVHCWEGYPNYCWYPQTKKELEEKGCKVDIPEMPDTALPKLSLWLPRLKEVAGKADEDLYLVGHSCGVITILRYLEQLPKNVKIGGAIFVAGFTDDLGYKELNNFFEKPIDFKKIKKGARQFILINSDNDPYVDIKQGKLLKKKLDAKLIIKQKMGHFSGPVDNEESCTSLPDVTKSVIKMA